MFEYDCPKCRQTTTLAALDSGKVQPCAKCGQQLRVIASDNAAPSPALAEAGSLGCGAPLLVLGCGFGGLILGGAILFFGAFRESLAFGSSTEKTVAENKRSEKSGDATDRPSREAKKETPKRKPDPPDQKPDPPDQKPDPPDPPKAAPGPQANPPKRNPPGQVEPPPPPVKVEPEKPKPPPADAATLKAQLADSSTPREKRVEAAKALGELGADHVPALAAAVANDSDAEVVRTAIAALGNLKASTKEVAQALDKALDHPQASVRIEAASALGRIGLDSETYRAILHAAGNKDVVCRKTLFNALPRFGSFVSDSPSVNLSKEAVPEITPCLASAAPEARLLAAYLLGALGEEAAPAVPALRKALAREKTPPVQREILRTFAAIGPKASASVPELKDVLNDANKDKEMTRRCAALALASVAEPDEGKTAYPVLARAMEFTSLQPAAPATPAAMPTRPRPRPIGLFRPPAAPPRPVAPARPRDPIEDAIHEWAKKALAKGKSPAALALVHAYKDSFIGSQEEKKNARKTALQVLAQIGPDAKSPQLYKILNTLTRAERAGRLLDYPEVVQAAKEAMTAIYRTK